MTLGIRELDPASLGCRPRRQCHPSALHTTGLGMLTTVGMCFRLPTLRTTTLGDLSGDVLSLKPHPGYWPDSPIACPIIDPPSRN